MKNKKEHYNIFSGIKTRQLQHRTIRFSEKHV